MGNQEYTPPVYQSHHEPLTGSISAGTCGPSHGASQNRFQQGVSVNSDEASQQERERRYQEEMRNERQQQAATSPTAREGTDGSEGQPVDRASPKKRKRNHPPQSMSQAECLNLGYDYPGLYRPSGSGNKLPSSATSVGSQTAPGQPQDSYSQPPLSRLPHPDSHPSRTSVPQMKPRSKIPYPDFLNDDEHCYPRGYLLSPADHDLDPPLNQRRCGPSMPTSYQPDPSDPPIRSSQQNRQPPDKISPSNTLGDTNATRRSSETLSNRSLSSTSGYEGGASNSIHHESNSSSASSLSPSKQLRRTHRPSISNSISGAENAITGSSSSSMEFRDRREPHDQRHAWSRGTVHRLPGREIVEERSGGGSRSSGRGVQVDVVRSSDMRMNIRNFVEENPETESLFRRGRESVTREYFQSPETESELRRRRESVSREYWRRSLGHELRQVQKREEEEHRLLAEIHREGEEIIEKWNAMFPGEDIEQYM